MLYASLQAARKAGHNMRWLRNALSLRARITASFTLIVVGGTVVSTLIGSRIITNALLDQARRWTSGPWLRPILGRP